MKTKFSLFAVLTFFYGYAFAQNPNGALRIEVTTAYNFIVDSNVGTPASYAPRAAYISARIWNDGPTDLTDVVAYVGNGTTNTPGVYPSVTNPATGQVGTFSLVHEGGSGGTTDATRYLGTIPAGGYAPVYWLVSYPNLDDNGTSVTRSIKPQDDLVLDYSVWATDGTLSAQVDRTATMRNCISAMANKIFPNTANKVPQEYQDLLAKYAPEWGNLAADGSPGTSIVTEGIWYDLGNVGAGFDNDGDLVPDHNAWLQPVGDPSLIDTGAFRLVNTYSLIVVKLKGGGELVYDVKDQLYFENIPENTGVIGLVRYDYLPLQPNATAQLSPYQMAASGFDNEKFNGDYGAGIGGRVASAPTPLTLEKSVDLAQAATGSTLVYTIPFSNPGTQIVGDSSTGYPLVIQDSIPADTTYVAASASLSGGLAHKTFFSTDNGSTWTLVEPAAASVTDIQWWLTEAFDPGESGTVTFSVTIDGTATTSVTNTAGLSFGNTPPFLQDSARTQILGINSLSGLVFEDNGAGGSGVFGDGVQNGTETYLEDITVDLYYDADGSGTVTGGDVLWGTTTSGIGNGTYSFTDLPDGNWLVAVDDADADLPTGATRTTDVVLTADLDAAGISVAAVSVPDLNFGFAPALILDKSGPASAQEGDLVTYTLDVSNQFDGDGSGTPAALTYSGWASSFTQPAQANKQWTNATNATGAFNGSSATGVFKSPEKTIGLSGFGFGDPPETITKVEVDLVMTKPGSFASGDDLTVRVINTTGPTTLGTYTINLADISNGTTTLDVTGAVNWSAINFSTQFRVELDTDVGGLTGTLLLDAVAVRVTTDSFSTVSSDLTLHPVPLTDSYEADKLEFVSAVPSPSGTDVTGSVGTLTWTDIGPIFPGGTESVEVTFLVLEPPSNTATTHNNVADVTGATFQNGDPANDATDTVVTTIDPAGSIAGTVWRDLDSQGDQDGGTETGIESVTVQLTPPSGVDLGAGVDVPITTTTDENGYYEFTGLPATGTYTVTVLTATLPGGAGTNTYDKDNGTTSPNNIAVQAIVYDSTTGADTVTDVDFGYNSSSSIIRGTLWEDLDRDGSAAPPENGEPLLEGVTVNLYEVGNPTAIATTTTAADGTYSFVGTWAGDYRVEVDPFTGPLGGSWLQTYDNDGLVNLNNVELNVVLGGSGVANFSYAHFGVLSIGDTLFYDWNGDGVQDAGEEGIPNVTVTIYNDAAGDGIYQAVEDGEIYVVETDINGQYLFDLLPAGNYVVVVDRTDPDMPPAYDVSGDPDGGFDALSGVALVGASDLDQDFGFDPEGAGGITGVVWRDVNADTVRLGGFETGIENITVTLQVDFNGDGIYEDLETTTTDSSGAYSFSNLPDGDFRVVVDSGDVDLPQDVFGNPWFASTGTSTVVSISSGTASASPEFGFASPAAIGDTIFFDINQNGVQDANEPGIENAVVDLYLDGAYVSSETTDADGLYLFDNLVPGDYEVRVNTGTGALNLVGVVLTSDPDSDGEPCTGPLANGCDGIRAQTLTAGKVFTGADFGYFLPGGVIGGTLWIDFNDDGIVDDTETPLPYVSVSLLNGANNVIATVETDENGQYSFGGLADDTYRIQVDGADTDIPSGITETFEIDGSTDEDVTGIVVSGGAVTGTYAGLGEEINFGYRFDGDNTLSGTVGLETTTINGVMGSGTSGVDGDEVAFENVTMYIYLWNDAGVLGTVESGETILLGTTTTDANGDYSVTGLPDGGANDYYIVSMVPPINALSLTTTVSDTPATILVDTVNAQLHSTGVYQAVPIPTEPTDDITDMDFAFESLLDYDFGDLPESYSVLLPGGARHVLSGSPTLYLGTLVDAEPNGVVSADSTAEGADDDGVTVTGIWENGTGGGSLDLEIVGEGYLVGYIDFNQNGNFLDDGEMVVSEAVSTGTISRSFDLPDGTLSEVSTTSLYSRFRLLPSEPFIPELAFSGEAASGEVEDYLSDFHVIAGTVFVDTEAGGLISANDAVQPGVIIELFKNGEVVPVATAVTDLNGDYSFYGLPPADYEIRMTAPSGATAILDVDGGVNGNNSIDRTLSSSLADQDFLIGTDVAQRLISGTTYVDTNDDGLFGGDTVIGSVTVNLYRDLNNDGIADANEFIGTQTTDGSGNYSFNGLVVADNYLVELETSGGVTAIRDLDNNADPDTLGLISVDVTSGNVAAQDFLTDFNGSISGVVEIDNDGDTLGDVAQSNVTVELLDAGNNVLDTTTTLGDGSYSFVGLAPGTYKVRQTVPTGYFAVNDVDGTDLTVIGDVTIITVAAAENITGQDFVNELNDATVGNFVWLDVDGDGLQDGGEPGLNGVTVNLLNSGGSVIDTVVTTNDGGGNPGYYEFTGILPGDYRVEFVLPADHAFTTQNADTLGLSGSANSDADTSTGRSDNFTLTYGDTQSDVDAGLLSADLAVVKSVDPLAVNVGDTITYTVTLTNLGTTRTTGVEVTEVFPFGVSYVSHTVTQGGYVSGTGIWTVGALDVGQTVTLELTATISAGNPGDAFGNTATITASDVPDPVLSNNSDTAVVEISGLTIVKTSNVSGSAAIGDTITYTVVVENIGAVTHAGVVVEDLLPAGVTYAGNLSVVMTNDSPLPTGTYTNSVAGASTFVVPDGVNSITVEAWGAGGSGSSANGNDAGGGGGGGGYARSVIATSPGTSFNLLVGAGGAFGGAGNPGNLGETTWFDAIGILRAGGGAGGIAPTGGVGGGDTGTDSNVGDATFLGGAGGNGATTGGTRGGGGGGGSATSTAVGGVGQVGSTADGGNGGIGEGNGGHGGYGDPASGGVPADPGLAPGGGGGGCFASGGGVGADGRIIISYDITGTVGTDAAPPTLATGYTLGAGATLTISYDVTVNDPVPSATLLNTASVRSQLSSTPIEASVEDPVLVGSISGTILLDTNNNTTGDSPHAGIVVELLDAAGNPVLDSLGDPKTAVTDVNGDYSFTLLTPGTDAYQVRQTVPNGFTAISDADGGDFTQIGDQTLISVTGGADTPDQDFVNSQYGVLDTPEFCLDLATNLDGTFIRPTGLPANVVFKLEYADELGDPTTWDGTITLTGSNTTVVDNGNGTETVTVNDVPTLTGLTSGYGFVRLRQELDATPGEVQVSTVSGWVDSAFGVACRTYNNPFLSCSPLSSTISSVSGQDLVLADVIPTLGAGTYYIEVTSGDNEGQRFDIASYTGSTLTLESDADLCDLVAPFNTLTGAPLANLAADTVVIRKHRTLNEVFPVDQMTAANDQANADQITLWDGSAFVCYYLYSNGGSPIWVAVGDGSLTDVGDTIIPPGHGSFVNSRGTKTLRAYGQVRENDFVRPLCSGVNLVGGGYPLDQSAASRAMTVPGFNGDPDFKLADQFLIWRGDVTPGLTSYYTYFLLDNVSFTGWIKHGDIFRNSQDAVILFEKNESVILDMGSAYLTYRMPLPWSP